MIVATLVLAVLAITVLAFAWFDGGREPVGVISQPVPEAAP